MRTGRLQVGSKVQDIASRARGMVARGRKGDVRPDYDRYKFTIQTTEEFEKGVWPPGYHGGYRGWFKLDEHGHIEDAECSCPYWESGEAKLPNGTTYCKHIGWAKLVYKRPDDEVYIRMGAKNGRGHHVKELRVGNELKEVPEGGSFEKIRERLERAGYSMVRTIAYPSDHTTARIYQKGAAA